MVWHHYILIQLRIRDDRRDVLYLFSYDFSNIRQPYLGTAGTARRDSPISDQVSKRRSFRSLVYDNQINAPEIIIMPPGSFVVPILHKGEIDVIGRLMVINTKLGRLFVIGK